MENFFLYRVYHYNKKLFFFFLIFAGATLVCNLMGNEITPFYVWGMYSEKEQPTPNYQFLKITANDKIIDYTSGYLPKNRFFLDWPLTYYSKIKDKKDPTEIFLRDKLGKNFSVIEPYAKQVLNSDKALKEFPAWYKRYLGQTTGEKIQSLKVEVFKATYDSNNTIRINAGYTLIDER